MQDSVAATVVTAEQAEASVPDADEFILSREFYDAYKTHKALADADDRKQTDIDQLSAKLKAIAFHCARLRLFSPNEELDDISTADLKYLLVPFLLAETVGSTVDMDTRLEALQQALVFWRGFAADCRRLEVAHSDDLRAADNDSPATDAASKRDEKIARHRRAKDLDEKVAYLFSKKREAIGDEYRWGSSAGFDEDLERELVLALLGRAVAQTADNIYSAEQELPLLEMMRERGGPGAAPPPKQAPAEKPFIVRIQDKAELMKLYHEMVFQCPFEQPTVSLAEYAEYEMEQMRENQAAKADHEQRSRAYEDDRWYNGDRYGAREDDEEETKVYKDRNWDDWKDEHPYGSGNKMANVS